MSGGKQQKRGKTAADRKHQKKRKTAADSMPEHPPQQRKDGNSSR